MRTGFTRVYITACVLVCLAVPLSAQTRKQPSGRDLPPLESAEQNTFCDVDIPPAHRRGLNFSWGMPDGEPLSFQQAPPILRADHSGSIGLSEFALLGDYATLTFEREDESAASGVAVERWQRTGTTTISGRTVSLFEPRWSRRVWSERLRHTRHGFDRPYILWGRVVLPSSVDTRPTASPETRPLYLRLGSSGMPSSHVRQIAPDIQYASHVVNLVLPGFGETRVSSGTYNFDLPTAARAFFAHFSDSYDSIAFIPQRTQVAEFGGFHRNIRNEVEGIGKPLLDQSHFYGSAGTLKSVEVYPQGQFRYQRRFEPRDRTPVGRRIRLGNAWRDRPRRVASLITHPPALSRGDPDRARYSKLHAGSRVSTPPASRSNRRPARCGSIRFRCIGWDFCRLTRCLTCGSSPTRISLRRVEAACPHPARPWPVARIA